MTATPDPALGQLVREAVALVSACSPAIIDAETRLSALSMDSLRMTQLAIEIEDRLGVEMNDQQLDRVLSAVSVSDLIAALAG